MNFIVTNFWFVAPLDGRHGRMGSAGSLRGANLVFFSYKRDNLPALID